MRFTIYGQSFRIRFRHEHYPSEDMPFNCDPILAGGTKYGKVRAVTTCYIERQVDQSWGVSMEGVASCSLDDRFQKEVGRKLSLQRALIGATKEFRTAVWTTYHIRSSKVVSVRKVHHQGENLEVL